MIGSEVALGCCCMRADIIPNFRIGSGRPGGGIPSPGDLPNPGNEPRPPELQVGSLLAEPQGKPKNTGVGSLSLLQWIFPTQDSNWGLLHCRQILYQLSYQGRPEKSLYGERMTNIS